MSKFFSKILKQKKTLVFLFAFITIIGLATPQFASASLTDWLGNLIYSTNNCGPAPTGGVAGMTTAQIQAAAQQSKAYADCMSGFSDSLKAAEDKLKVVDKMVKYIYLGFVMGIATVILVVTDTLANIMGMLFMWIMSAGQTVSYTHITGPDANAAVAAGWPRVRDLANMIVVLGFIVIGIATSLRIKEYEAKKLLPKLIVAALLVNFSLLFCGIVIDGANIITKGFGSSGGSYLEKSWQDSILGATKTMWNNFNVDDVAQALGATVGLVFGEVMRLIVYALYFFLFLFRYIALWILVILSPLAFVCWVFPFTKRFWDMWLSNFLQWAIIGIPGMFFIWLSDNITSSMLQTGSTTGAGAASVAGGALTFMAYLIPGSFMIIGFLFSLQTSAIGAGAAISAVKRGGKSAGGAAWELSGRNRYAQATREAISNKLAQAQTMLGLKQEGYPAQQKAAREAAARKQIDSLRTSSSAGDRSRYEALAHHGRGSMGAAAITAANEHGDLSRIMGGDLNAMNGRVGYATQFGHERSEFEKKNYQLSGLNDNKMNDALRGMGVNPAAADDAQRAAARQRAIQTQLGANLQQMSPGEIRAINYRHVGGRDGYNMVRENFTPHMVDQLQTASDPNLIAAVRSHAGNLRHDINVARGANNNGEANRLQKMLDSIERLPH